MEQFKMKATQNLYELMNCFEPNISTTNRLVGPGEGVFMVMMKDNDIHSMGDASLNEQQALAVINHMSMFLNKLTAHSAYLIGRKRGG